MQIRRSGRFKLTSTNNNVGNNELEALPIRQLNFSVKNDKNIQEQFIKLTSNLLDLNKELDVEKLPNKIDQIKQRIEHSEDKINQLVYELYELTEDEIKIVEESTQK